MNNSKIKKIINKLTNKNKEGASLVSVVIGTIFLLAIGLTVLTIATQYIVSVYVDRNSTENFSGTEQIVSEIRTGLLEYAGDSAEKAYKEVAEQYTKTSETMQMAFSRKYLAYLGKKITGVDIDENDLKYDGSVVDPKLAKLIPFSDASGTDKKLNPIRNLVKSVKTDDEKKLVIYEKTGTTAGIIINFDKNEGYTMTLKNVVVDYTDEYGYRSKISTDILFKVPNYRFEGDATLDELKNYISVSDGKLDITAVNPTFEGNIYSGWSDTLSPADAVKGYPISDDGIVISSAGSVNFKGDKIISRGDLDVEKGNTVTLQGRNVEQGDLYLNNLVARKGTASTGYSTITINENSYISNDLNILDDGVTVNLCGKYYGYSYNDSNSTSGGMNSEYSSAILINGLNTTLNAGGTGAFPKGLTKLVLAGRSFVEQNDKGAAGVQSVPSQIYMGESLSVRSNQLAYLVPDDYININTSRGDISKNPVLTSEVSTTPIKVTDLINAFIIKDDSGNPTSECYLDTTKPYIENYTNDGYVYYFLKFGSEKKANQYFKDYYNGKVNNFDEYNNTESAEDMRDKIGSQGQTYLSNFDGTGTRFSSELYLVAGNIIYDYESTDEKIKDANYLSGDTPKASLLTDAKKMALNYLGLCKNLLNSGSTGRESSIRLKNSGYENEYDTSDTSKQSEPPLVEERSNSGVTTGIIDKTAAQNLASTGKKIYKKNSVSGDWENVSVCEPNSADPSNPNEYILVANGDDYTLDVNCQKGLVIHCGAKINVNHNFTGLILSTGVVDVSGFSSGQLKADSAVVGKLIENIKTDSGLVEVKNIFTALKNDNGDDETALEKCVGYQNWTKDEE